MSIETNFIYLIQNDINQFITENFLTLGLLDRFQTTIDLDIELNESLIDEFINRLLESISISNKRNTDMINVSVRSLNPEEASLTCQYSC